MEVSDKMKNPSELDRSFVCWERVIGNSWNEGLEPLSSVLSSRFTFCHDERAVWRLYPEHICVMPAPPVIRLSSIGVRLVPYLVGPGARMHEKRSLAISSGGRHQACEIGIAGGLLQEPRDRVTHGRLQPLPSHSSHHTVP